MIENKNKLKRKNTAIIFAVIFICIVLIFSIKEFVVWKIDNTRSDADSYVSKELTAEYPIVSRYEEFTIYGMNSEFEDEEYLTFYIIENNVENIVYRWDNSIKINGEDFIKWFDSKTVICYSSEKNACMYIRNLNGIWKTSDWIYEDDFWDWEFDD